MFFFNTLVLENEKNNNKTTRNKQIDVHASQIGQVVTDLQVVW